MKLSVSNRDAEKKGTKNLMREKGDIPAVLYSKGKESQLLAANGAEFHAILRKIQKGHLPTTVIELEGEGVKTKVIVKDIQYDPTTYDILHLDFFELNDKAIISVNVPIECTGAAECEGIKLGGFLRQVIRHLKVRCLPKDLPNMFTVDVAELSIKQTKRIKDIVMPKGVEPLAPLNEVVVLIAKR
ncbi:MAG: hypothetical protein S4CHLAM37_09430 [Chlamydiia bacterium]|nr:hypothetical protein [Chlamydiia bacterium]